MSFAEIAFEFESVEYAIKFPPELASKMAQAVIVPHEPEAVGKVKVAVLLAVVGLVPDTEKVADTLE
tara:strand:+ start:2054 stop:2254 length:201 start_codon:yes stop_codon:yes gene_type:complete